MQTTNTYKMETKRYKFIAVTDSVTECDCCGRVNLKKTYVLEDTIDSSEHYFGAVCGAKIMNETVKEFNFRVSSHKKARKSEFIKKLRQIRGQFFKVSQSTYEDMIREIQTEFPEWKKKAYNIDFTVSPPVKI